MNFKKPVTTALVIASGLALAAPAVRADNTAYTQGDLIIGFEQTGNANNLEADLGPASNFINATSAFNVTFGLVPTGQTGAGSTVTNLNADLGAVFGLNWADNTQANPVQWGVAGSTYKFGSTFSLIKNTVFLTKAQDSAGGAWARPTTSAATNINAKANSFTNGSGGFSNEPSTNNSTVATVLTASQTNSWSSFTPHTSAFGSGFNIEQATDSGANTGPTNSLLNLYAVQPNGTNGGGDSTLLGTFSLNTAGQLTFSPVTVPEPSTYALTAIGGALLLGALRRKRRTLQPVHASL